MKVVHLSTGDGGGGAGVAARRLHETLRRRGIESRLLVGYRTSADPDIVAAADRRLLDSCRRFDRLVARSLRTTNRSLLSPACFGALRPGRVAAERAHLTHLHWTCGGFLRLESLRHLPGPLVWSLHDMWAFSGAEHYAAGSERFRAGYRSGNRPAGERGFDLNRWVWERKRRLLPTLPALTIVCVSEWLADCARASPLLRDREVRVLHNGIDVAVFRPQPAAAVRAELGLPPARKLVLFGAVQGAADPRKGFDLLVAALDRLRSAGEACDLVVFGNAAADRPGLARWGFPVHAFDEVTDPARLAKLYAACDVMVVPSREEAFGQTAAEAMACGTPVVGFRVGGLPEIVADRVTGWLAAPFDVTSLAEGIHWILHAPRAPRAALAGAARRVVEQRFSAAQQGRRCEALYDQVLGAASAARPAPGAPEPHPALASGHSWEGRA